jgi:hypothetical protein
MNIDGLQELIMNRTTSSTKPDTTRYATPLNARFPPLGQADVPHVSAPARRNSQHHSR